MARRKARRRSARAASPAPRRRRRRRSIRRNPGVFAANPKTNPRRRRRRSYHRNPAFNVKGALAVVQDAGIGAALALAGKIGSKFATNMIGLQPGIVEIGARGAIGIGAGIALQGFIGRARARDVALGVILGVYESVAKQFNIPIVKDYLGDDDYQVLYVPPGANGGAQLGTWAEPAQPQMVM